MSIQDSLEKFQYDVINENSVEALMKSLIERYVLKVNGDIYNFCEIELYYYNQEKHDDCGVLKRNNQAGDLFFHRYGFDICFNSNNNNEYGGILIRSLKKGDEYILGPLTCSLVLLNKYSPNINISIVENNNTVAEQEIYLTKRVRSCCTNENRKKYNESLYRAITKDLDRYINNEQNNIKKEHKNYFEKIQKYCKEKND